MLLTAGVQELSLCSDINVSAIFSLFFHKEIWPQGSLPPKLSVLWNLQFTLLSIDIVMSRQIEFLIFGCTIT